MDPREMKDLVLEIKKLSVEAAGGTNIKIGEKGLLALRNAEGGYDLINPSDKEPNHRPSCLDVHTLAGLTDYVKDNRESLDNKKIFLLINNESTVNLYSIAQGPRNNRYIIVQANDVFGKPFLFDSWLTQEEFIIQLSTRMEESPDRDTLLEVAGALVAENDNALNDDGVSTTKRSKSGVVSMSGQTIPKVVSLKPFRTFRDIEQPGSPFILRMAQEDGDIRIKLIEADGGLWRYKAVEGIKTHLKKALPEVQVIG